MIGPLSIAAVLVLLALITVVLAAMQKCPLYVPVLILVILEMLRIFPVK